MPRFYRECRFCGLLSNSFPSNTKEEAYSIGLNKELNCHYCGQPTCESNFTIPYPCITSERDQKEEEYEKILYDVYVKSNPENYQYYLKRLETERKDEEKYENTTGKELREKYPKSFAKASSGNSDNEITCPTCHSTNVVKIDGLERGASILMWGIFSKKRDKTFKCKHCGYMW